jgi:rhodanese-related sulfurtransferase
MKKFSDLIQDVINEVKEIYPWDLDEKLNNNEDILLLDIREPYEYEIVRVKDSINVARGILESACEYNYAETVPELVEARDKEVVVICRSGNRSVLAAYTMQLMGYQNVSSLKTGVNGWNDYELPMVDMNEELVDIDDADDYFNAPLRPEQLSKNH